MISPAVTSYEQIDQDVRLMMAVRDDNREAFEQLVGKHERWVRIFLQSRTGNRHQAEDLTQEVFLRVFRSRYAYKPTAKFATWLTVIVRNVATNANRDQARRLETYLPDDDDQTDPLGKLTHGNFAESPAAQLERAELRKVVRSAVGQLCDRQRRAVVLQRFQHMKYDQIASSMSTSPKAVKSLLARARERLRDELTPYVGDAQP